MTAVVEPVKVPTSLGSAWPQVNLLPPEVRAARGLRVVKGWLAIGLTLTLLACGGGYLLGMISVSDAETELADAQADTARIQAEQATYAEVPEVLGTLATATSARNLGMSTEVLWKGYLGAIAAVLPTEVSIESYTVAGATPMTAATLPLDPLQRPSVGQITFSLRSATLPDTAAWIDALNSIPGFTDAWFASAAITATETTSYYTVESTVQFTSDAYALRFSAPDGTN